MYLKHMPMENFGFRREWFCAQAHVKVLSGVHRASPAGLPIEQVLGEHSLS